MGCNLFGFGFKSKTTSVLKNKFNYPVTAMHSLVLKQICNEALRQGLNEYDAAILFMTVQINSITEKSDRANAFVEIQTQNIKAVMDLAATPNQDILDFLNAALDAVSAHSTVSNNNNSQKTSITNPKSSAKRQPERSTKEIIANQEIPNFKPDNHSRKTIEADEIGGSTAKAEAAPATGKSDVLALFDQFGDDPEAFVKALQARNRGEDVSTPTAPDIPLERGTKLLIIRSKNDPNIVRMISPKQAKNGGDVYTLIGKSGTPDDWEVRYAPKENYSVLKSDLRELFDRLPEGGGTDGILPEAGFATGIGRAMTQTEAGTPISERIDELRKKMSDEIDPLRSRKSNLISKSQPTVDSNESNGLHPFADARDVPIFDDQGRALLLRNRICPAQVLAPSFVISYLCPSLSLEHYEREKEFFKKNELFEKDNYTTRRLKHYMTNAMSQIQNWEIAYLDETSLEPGIQDRGLELSLYSAFMAEEAYKPYGLNDGLNEIAEDVFEKIDARYLRSALVEPLHPYINWNDVPLSNEIGYLLIVRSIHRPEVLFSISHDLIHRKEFAQKQLADLGSPIDYEIGYYWAGIYTPTDNEEILLYNINREKILLYNSEDTVHPFGHSKKLVKDCDLWLQQMREWFPPSFLDLIGPTKI